MSPTKNLFNGIYYCTNGEKSGVPKVSVIGPTRLLLYINGIMHTGLSAEVVGYADDTVLLYSGKNETDIQTIANENLGRFWRYLDDYKQVLNVGKTNFIIYKLTNKPEIHPNIKIQRIDIKACK